MSPCMQIHVMQEGQQFGPYSKAQLESYLWEGNAQRSDLAWVEGTDDWLPLWQVMGLAPQPGELPESDEAVEPVADELPTAEEPVPEIVAEEVEPAPLPVAAEAPIEVTEETVEVEEQVIEDLVAEETAPEPVVDDGKPKLIIPTAAPKRKLKLNLPNG